MKIARTIIQSLALLAIAAGALLAAGRASAQPPPDYGIDLVTVGAVGNAPYDGEDPFYFAYGRGRVDYEYRIGRTEITTAQWMEFVNTFAVQGLRESFVFGPASWGGQGGGPGRAYSLRTDVPNAAMLPVFGMSWREAATFCNWLHNGKSSDPVSLRSGAYDTSTFGFNPDFTYNDQQTRSPGALFWIPSYDEWLKAAHYDPNKNGPGVGGYWTFSNGTEFEPVAGPPGIGETSAGYVDPIIPLGEFDLPLGSYPGTVSPWGLLDTSGGTTEWTEGEWGTQFFGSRWRIADGARAGSRESNYADYIWSGQTADPAMVGGFGLRIATVPSSGVLIPASLSLFWSLTIRSRSRR